MNATQQALLERISDLESQLRSPPPVKRLTYEEKCILREAINDCPLSKAGAVINAIQADPLYSGVDVRELDDEEVDMDILEEETLVNLQVILGESALQAAELRIKEQANKKRSRTDTQPVDTNNKKQRRRTPKPFVPYSPGSRGRPPAWYILMAKESPEALRRYEIGDYQAKEALYKEWNGIHKQTRVGVPKR